MLRSDGEVRTQERNCHLSPRIISSKLPGKGNRLSQTGVVLKRMRYRLRRSDHSYSYGVLADLMDVYLNKVRMWTRRGLLQAQRLSIERQVQQFSSEGEWYI